jgi:lipopolysaccharide transport system ATP-binding protein
MMPHVTIVVDGLGKQYRLGQKQASYGTLRESIVGSSLSALSGIKALVANSTERKSQDGWMWALKDVSFQVNRGEVVGIIGRNGAGKSTLLKILSQITEPTEGCAEIHGRVGSLLEVGTGFHPELTGRENVFLNGAILGMKKKEIESKFDQIVAFAEVERFIDTAVKHYSSGMYLRLAFAVAAHLEPEILIVDEVLAVGDAIFQRKCLGKIGDVAKGGRTVLFVSHNMGAISQLCNRVLWVQDGRLKREGPAGDTIGAYLSAGETARSTWRREQDHVSLNEVDVTSACVLSDEGKSIEIADFDKAFQVRIAYEVKRPVGNLAVLCRVSDMQGNIIWTSWDTDTTSWAGEIRAPGSWLSICKMPKAVLRPGRYHLSVGAHQSNGKVFGYYENVITLDISEVGYRLNMNRIGIATPLLDWEVKQDGGAIPSSSNSPHFIE